MNLVTYIAGLVLSTFFAISGNKWAEVDAVAGAIYFAAGGIMFMLVLGFDSLNPTPNKKNKRGN